jgi:hypothetical protein
MIKHKLIKDIFVSLLLAAALLFSTRLAASGILRYSPPGISFKIPTQGVAVFPDLLENLRPGITRELTGELRFNVK